VDKTAKRQQKHNLGQGKGLKGSKNFVGSLLGKVEGNGSRLKGLGRGAAPERE